MFGSSVDHVLCEPMMELSTFGDTVHSFPEPDGSLWSSVPFRARQQVLEEELGEIVLYPVHSSRLSRLEEDVEEKEDVLLVVPGPVADLPLEYVEPDKVSILELTKIIPFLPVHVHMKGKPKEIIKFEGIDSHL